VVVVFCDGRRYEVVATLMTRIDGWQARLLMVAVSIASVEGAT
jgi:hypothetical protein